MSEHQVKIRRKGHGHVVEIGGHEIQNLVMGLTLAIKGGAMPELHLDMIAEGEDIETVARVTMPEPFRKALIALGWTPPDEG